MIYLSVKMVVLKVSQNLQENTYALESKARVTSRKLRVQIDE